MQACVLMVGGLGNASAIRDAIAALGAEVRCVQIVDRSHVAYVWRNRGIVVHLADREPVLEVQALRSVFGDSPIITFAHDLDGAHVRALESSGASACCALPVSASQVEAALRRTIVSNVRTLPLWFDRIANEVGRGALAVRLSPVEFSILRCLADTPEDVVQSERLWIYTWGDVAPPPNTAQVLAVYVHRIRRKIAPLRVVAVLSVRGVGYRLQLNSGV